MLLISGKSSFRSRWASSVSSAAASSPASNWRRIKEMSSVKNKTRPSKRTRSGLLLIGCELIKSPTLGFATLIIDYNLTSGKTFNGRLASQAGWKRAGGIEDDSVDTEGF